MPVADFVPSESLPVCVWSGEGDSSREESPSAFQRAIEGKNGVSFSLLVLCRSVSFII